MSWNLTATHGEFAPLEMAWNNVRMEEVNGIGDCIRSFRTCLDL